MTELPSGSPAASTATVPDHCEVTEMAAKPYAGGGKERISANIPLGRVADARDIAGPIVFLCSDLARHITGEIVNVNGGSVLCG